MIDLEPTIATIERLIEEGTDSSLTYAALECRLAIEKLCYDRLRAAHDYISAADIARWQPRDIINKLIREVDPRAATHFTLSISRTPLPDQIVDIEVEDYQGAEWIEVGTQSGFDPEQIGKLWNALSGLALHAVIPVTKDAPLPQYGDGTKIRPKVIEALELIRNVAAGTLVSSGLGKTVSFDCTCGTRNKRKADLLGARAKVSCINPGCFESYVYDETECHFERRVFTAHCENCAHEYLIPLRYLERLRCGQELTARCANCPGSVRVALRPMVANSATLGPDTT